MVAAVSLDSPPVSLYESRWKTGGFAFGGGLVCVFVVFGMHLAPPKDLPTWAAGFGFAVLFGLAVPVYLFHVFNPGVLTVDQQGFQVTFRKLIGVRTQRRAWSEIDRFDLCRRPTAGGSVFVSNYDVGWWRALPQDRLQRVADNASSVFVKLEGDWAMSQQGLVDFLNQAHMRWATPEAS